MSETLIRQLDLSDVIFSGYGYTVGADIFALIPYITKNAKEYTWLAFIIGGLISILNSLSYAKLNIEYPSNDAEYSWIKNSLSVDEPKTEKDEKHNRNVKTFAKVVIWAVIILGITMNSVMIVSISNFLTKMGVKSSKHVMNLIIALVPTLLNFLNVKHMSVANIMVTIITTVTLSMLPVLSLFKHEHFVDLIPGSLGDSSLQNILKAIAITILPYNGYQSVVQMSEEVKDVNNIPKGMLISGSMTIILYTLLSVGLIAILGVSNVSKSKTPIADAFSIFFGKYSGNIVNMVGILTGFTTLLLSIYSRSRLLSKLGELNIGPKVFDNYGIGNALKGIPVYSIVIIGILSYIFTILKEDSLEILTDITNVLTIFVFICVNACVIYSYYFKDKKKEKDEDQTLLGRLKDSAPIYAVIAIIILCILFVKAIKDFND